MIARVAAVGAVVLVAVAAAFLLLGGNGGTKYALLFDNAGQLVKDNDVRIGGKRVGAITDIELTKDNMAKVSVTVNEDFAPLHEGTTGVIRLTSLSGVANRYIALTAGPQSAPELEPGAVLGADKTTGVVDLDQLIDTFDDKTRADLQKTVQGFATALDGKGKQAGEANKYLNSTLSTSRKLVEELTADDDALTAVLVNGSRAVSALAERRGDLASAVRDTRQTAGAIADESESLDTALGVLPTTIRRANTTFVNLRFTLDDLDRLVDVSKPATRDLAPFLRELRPLLRDARPTVADLDRLVRRPGADNDLVDATRKLPGLADAATPAFQSTTRALRKAQPVVEFYRGYTPDLVGWFRDFGQGAATYDANGHYARVQPIFNAFSLQGGSLQAQPASARLDGLDVGNYARCPGGGSQTPADGSGNSGAGLPDGSCDPGAAPPGP